MYSKLYEENVVLNFTNGWCQTPALNNMHILTWFRINVDKYKLAFCKLKVINLYFDLCKGFSPAVV